MGGGMKRRQGILGYDSDLDRFCFDCECDARTSLHCGDVLGIRIGTEYVPCRIECDGEKRWYVIFPSSPERESAFILRRGHWYDACMSWHW